MKGNLTWVWPEEPLSWRLSLRLETEWWKVQPTERCHLTFRVGLPLNYPNLKSSSHHAQRFISLIILDSAKLTIRIKHHSPQRSPRRGFFDLFIIGHLSHVSKPAEAVLPSEVIPRDSELELSLKMFKQCLKVGVFYNVHLEAFENTVTHKTRLWRFFKK